MARGSLQIHAKSRELPAGGGPFQLHNLTVGIFLVDQNHHRLAVGTDITSCIPLRAGEGWILPARASGICEFDETLSYLTLEFPDDLLRETGWDQPDFTPLVGGLDPLLVQMVKNAVATTETSDSLYRQTMSISAAAHLTHVLSPRHVPAISIDDRRLRKAIAYIHDNLMGELSLHAMASEAADLGAAPAQGPHRQTGQVRRRWSGRRVRQGTASSDGFSKSFISPERATGPREDETSARMMSQEIM